MAWSNGQVLVVSDNSGKELRMLVQDGSINVVADGPSLTPDTMRHLAVLLYEGASQLDPEPFVP